MDSAFIICRLLHFTAAMLLFGIAVFQTLLAPPSLARSLDHSLRRLIVAAVLVIAVTTVAWLLLQTAEMGEGWADVSPEALRTVLLDTEFGRTWQLHLGLAVWLTALLVLRRLDHWPITSVASALFLASLGLVGHAAMQTGVLGWLHRINHAVHLLSAGFWLGSLVPLTLCLVEGTFSADVSTALRRFSGLGHLAVALVIATGVINTWLVLDSWPTDLASPYQRLLLLKIILVAAMAAIALINRYLLVPRLQRNRTAFRSIRRNTISEIILGCGVMLIVSILGTLEPV